MVWSYLFDNAIIALKYVLWISKFTVVKIMSYGNIISNRLWAFRVEGGWAVGGPWGAAKNVQINLIEQQNESCAG